MDKESKSKIAFWAALIGTTLLNLASALGHNPELVRGKPKAEKFEARTETGTPDVYVSDRKWLLQKFDRIETSLTLIVDRLEALEKREPRTAKR